MLTPLLLIRGEEDGADALLGEFDLSAWDALFAEEAPDVGFTPSDFAYAIADASVDADDGLFNRLTGALIPALKTAAGKGVLLLGLAVFAALLNGVQGPAASETAQTAFRIVTAGAALLSVAAGMREAYRTVSAAGDAVGIVLPVLLGFLTFGGMENSALAVSASFSLYTGTVLRVLRTTVMPLACAGGIFAALDVSETARVASVGRLLQRAARWVLGVTGSLFGVLNALRGAAAAGADGYLLRTVKLAAGSLPAVGGMAAASAETVYQCLMLARNAIGLTGVALLVLIAARPVLSMFFTRCALRCARALSEPLAGRPYAELLRALSDTMQILLLSELIAYGLPVLAIAPALRVGGYA